MHPKPPLSHRGPLSRIPLRPQDLVAPVTATQDMFTLAHLGIPVLSAADWRLEIDGMVDRPMTLTLPQLKALPRAVLESVHECAGNPMQPHVPQRRVINLRWGGATLAAMMDLARVQAQATYLWSYGADHGDLAGVACDAYVKDLPLDRIDPEDVLVAYEVNGEELPQQHGFPVRLVVPGFYGTNSVKWLYRMTFADARANSLFTTRFYNDLADGQTIPVWAIAPECVIVQPAPGATLAVGADTIVWGWAWGHDPIEAVAVSVDSGESWAPARVAARAGHGWHRFTFDWQPRHAGPVTIAARATDVRGSTQPVSGARNEVHTVPVTVGA